MPIPTRMRFAAALTMFASLVLSGPSAAQDRNDEPAPRAGGPAFSIELNRAVPTDDGCRLGFVTTNKLGSDLSKAAFEIVLFNPEGLIERLLVLDFGVMAEGRTKVREFNLSGSSCETIDRVLVNDVSACEGEGVTNEVCASALTASSRGDISLGL
ncbi:hypothetical protein FP2506_16134 [Fulvimarina pelagi HTCC2506]|uniref:Tat pathway signal sequence domain protein n=1 Tax=Fulvimarina pelagi HTCC2506 TaxID=314231 RepID=Q0G353_9HYPH|nr:hypothetical protein [Fulvimarina pelagi]EAU41978.1 hypothetical protein FP2506_16134 [Fulvimarina pelagi HTCC2506]